MRHATAEENLTFVSVQWYLELLAYIVLISTHDDALDAIRDGCGGQVTAHRPFLYLSPCLYSKDETCR